MTAQADLFGAPAILGLARRDAVIDARDEIALIARIENAVLERHAKTPSPLLIWHALVGITQRWVGKVLPSERTNLDSLPPCPS